MIAPRTPSERIVAWAASSPARAAAAFAAAAFLESLFVPFLIDALLLALVLGGAPLWRLAAIGAAASLAGTMVWYGLGAYFGGDVIALAVKAFAIPPSVEVETGRLWAENWALALVIASTTAIPDPLAAGIAGASGVPPLGAFAALGLGHAARFAVLAGVVWVGGRMLGRTKTLWRARVGALALVVGVGLGAVLGVVVALRLLQGG